MSIGAITHQEITAWSDGMKKYIDPFEREAIIAIDTAFIQSSFTKDKK